VEAKRIAHRFYLGPILYGVGTLLGAFVPVLGIVVFAVLIPFYWLPPATRWARKPRSVQG
jgi:TM2 domain-containing membrane protein YozV